MFDEIVWVSPAASDCDDPLLAGMALCLIHFCEIERSGPYLIFTRSNGVQCRASRENGSLLAEWILPNWTDWKPASSGAVSLAVRLYNNQRVANPEPLRIRGGIWKAHFMDSVRDLANRQFGQSFTLMPVYPEED